MLPNLRLSSLQVKYLPLTRTPQGGSYALLTASRSCTCHEGTYPIDRSGPVQAEAVDRAYSTYGAAQYRFHPAA